VKQTTYDMANLKINSCSQTIFINPVLGNEVEKVVKDLKEKHSSVFDDVMDSIVKKCVQYIKKPLADICNASFASGTFPEQLKVAIVKPLHKKGNTGEVQNYRPISLLSVFSKMNNKGLIKNLAIQDYQTCHRSDFQIQLCRTDIFKKSVNNLGTKLYNKLPNYFKNLDNSQLFKKTTQSLFTTMNLLYSR
jgi:hypothetical protein